jgi:hypothetical protein
MHKETVLINHSLSAVSQVLKVCSISRTAWNILLVAPLQVSLLASFTNCIDLVVGDEIVALVTPSLKNGVFHVVVDHLPGRSLPEAFPVRWEPEGLWVDSWLLELGDPSPLWDPCPSWKDISIARPALELLTQYVVSEAACRRTLSLFGKLLLGELQPQVEALGAAIVAGDDMALSTASRHLAGLGPGLTPAGDDFLAGVMLAVHAGRLPVERKSKICAGIYSAALGQTTRLSLAFLKAACQGLADERWHNLLYALSREPLEIHAAARDALRFGETSGLDMVSGFLWLCNTMNVNG